MPTNSSGRCTQIFQADIDSKRNARRNRRDGLGKALQRRLVRKLDLEKAISEIAPYPSPKAYLEQYTITAEAAAEILFMATYIYDDITHKKVLDLGCGTGRLAIGAALLGAKEIVGVDIDKIAIRQAIMSAKGLGIRQRVNWIIADIEAIRGSFDTVLQNPPFGVQRRGADTGFLKKLLRAVDVFIRCTKA